MNDRYTSVACRLRYKRFPSSFITKLIFYLDGHSLHEHKSHPGGDPSFVIQACLFVVLGIVLFAAIVFLHMKIYKKRRRQIKGTESNENKYEAHLRERQRHEEESIAFKPPTVQPEDDDEFVSPTFKLVQPPKTEPAFVHYPGTSTNV